MSGKALHFPLPSRPPQAWPALIPVGRPFERLTKGPRKGCERAAKPFIQVMKRPSSRHGTIPFMPVLPFARIVSSPLPLTPNVRRLVTGKRRSGVRRRGKDARCNPLDAGSRARARFPVVNDNRPVVL
jgi:hypothetical protein